MIKAIILMLVCVSIVQSVADSAPTGVSFTTYPEAGCEGVMVMVVNPTLKTFQDSLVAGTCSDGKVTAPGSASETGYAKEYTNKECMEINPAVGQTKSAKLSWTVETSTLFFLIAAIFYL